MTRALTAVALPAVLAVMLTACGGDTESTTPEGPPASSSPTVVTPSGFVDPSATGGSASVPPPIQPPSAQPPSVPPLTRSSTGNVVYYPDCAAARAVGAAPLNRDHPGYRPELDRDGDGIACEN